MTQPRPEYAERVDGTRRLREWRDRIDVSQPLCEGVLSTNLSRAQLTLLAELMAVAARAHRTLPPKLAYLEPNACGDMVGVSVEWIDGPQSGRYSRRGSQAVIGIRRGAPQGRQALTMAHELGHHFVEEARGNSVYRRLLPPSALRLLRLLEVAGPVEERLCDAFGKSILLPGPAMRRQVGSRTVSLSLVQEISAAWGVPLGATAARLFDLELSDGMIVRGRIQGQALEVKSWSWRGSEMSNPNRLECRMRSGSVLTVGSYRLPALLRGAESVVEVQTQVHVDRDGRAVAFVVPRSPGVSRFVVRTATSAKRHARAGRFLRRLTDRFGRAVA